MSCPFCGIAAGVPPSAHPAILTTPVGSAFPVLSTQLVVAFLDIFPLTTGHVLICPRNHSTKASDVSSAEAAAIGFWLPVIGRAVMKSLWGGTEGSWNVVQANGTEAGQTIPHVHFHVIPRKQGEGRDSSEIKDAERANLALGEGARSKLDPEEGKRVSAIVKSEIAKEVQALIDAGEIEANPESPGEFWMKSSARGLKL
ncbi:HIT-like domain-containing protein [Xylogone sp. PMI_703]|nr:HIT-like domain-containing protein [Xylogone sp. PMI_703]